MRADRKGRKITRTEKNGFEGVRHLQSVSTFSIVNDPRCHFENSYIFGVAL